MEVHFRTERNEAIVGYSQYNGSLPRKGDDIIHASKGYTVVRIVFELGSRPIAFVYCKEIMKK